MNTSGLIFDIIRFEIYERLKIQYKLNDYRTPSDDEMNYIKEKFDNFVYMSKLEVKI